MATTIVRTDLRVTFRWISYPEVKLALYFHAMTKAPDEYYGTNTDGGPWV